MKLVTFVSQGRERIGAVMADGRILDFHGADQRLAVDMLTLIRRQDQLMPLAQALEARPGPCLLDPAGITLLAPVPRPVAMRDGYAFRQHVATARANRGMEMVPTGRELCNCTLEQADAAIFGYMIMNDWSARALQMEEMKLSLGPCKGKDFATGLGPWLVTKDELPLEASAQGQVLRARMTCAVNGRLLSDGNADSMNWTFAQILQRTAYGARLNPGEVLGSGTVGTGCLLELNGSKVTDNLWLKVGDTVTMAVEGLGRLENTVVQGQGIDLPFTLVAQGPRSL